MEEIKKEWRPGFLDDTLKTGKEALEILKRYLEYAKEREKKEAEEAIKK